MRITPLDVHEQTFRMAFRGFDPAEVDSFLQRLADELERLIEERDRLRAELESEKEARKTLEEALGAARALQDNILETARSEAEVIQNQAHVKADRILAEANEELVRMRRELGTLKERRSLWLAELEALGTTLERWVRERSAAEIGGPALISDPPAESELEEQAPDAPPGDEDDAL